MNDISQLSHTFFFLLVYSRTLKESKVARKNILQSRDNEEKKMRSDLKDMYENTQLQLKSLKSVYMKNSRKLRVESK